jgi:hypothetical protein
VIDEKTKKGLLRWGKVGKKLLFLLQPLLEPEEKEFVKTQREIQKLSRLWDSYTGGGRYGCDEGRETSRKIKKLAKESADKLTAARVSKDRQDFLHWLVSLSEIEKALSEGSYLNWDLKWFVNNLYMHGVPFWLALYAEDLGAKSELKFLKQSHLEYLREAAK